MADHTTAGKLAETVSEFLGQPSELRRLSQAGMSLVDGEGANRVAAVA